MRDTLIELLRCPRCRSEGAFDLEATSRDEHEIREGLLTCQACAQQYAVTKGFVDLLYDPPEYVVREAAGLERFADRMRRDAWDKERIRALPEADDGYWYVQRASFAQLLETVPFAAGQRLLDVGSNTCWASNQFAKRGLEVIALDIATAELQGLETADYFLETGDVYFERVLSTMADPAIASNSLDYVFCCEVLHHNDGPELRRTLKELYRVLRPGGQLLVINEPLKFARNLKRDHAVEVAEFEGNEHVHFFHQYYLAVRRAGFAVSLRIPPYNFFFSSAPNQLELHQPLSKVLKQVIWHALRRSRVGRRAYYAWLTVVTGDVSLNLVATKPKSA